MRMVVSSFLLMRSFTLSSTLSHYKKLATGHWTWRRKALRDWNPTLFGDKMHVKPGVLELYIGPMKSGKTLAAIHRVEGLNYRDDVDFIFVKPKLDVREVGVTSRFGARQYDPVVADHEHPGCLYELLRPWHRVVVIDELQFFGEGIVPVIRQLLVGGMNIIGAGLDTNFRGEPFGYMPHLVGLASEVQKHTSVCEVAGCNTDAPLTQRLIDGQPAPYDSPEILVGDAEEGYEPRCIRHHEVPMLEPS